MELSEYVERLQGGAEVRVEVWAPGVVARPWRGSLVDLQAALGGRGRSTVEPAGLAALLEQLRSQLVRTEGEVGPDAECRVLVEPGRDRMDPISVGQLRALVAHGGPLDPWFPPPSNLPVGRTAMWLRDTLFAELQTGAYDHRTPHEPVYLALRSRQNYAHIPGVPVADLRALLDNWTARPARPLRLRPSTTVARMVASLAAAMEHYGPDRDPHHVLLGLWPAPTSELTVGDVRKVVEQFAAGRGAVPMGLEPPGIPDWAELTKLRHTIDRLEAENADLSGQLDTAKANVRTIERLEAQLDNKDTAIAGIEEDRDQLRERVDQLESSLIEARERIADITLAGAPKVDALGTGPKTVGAWSPDDIVQALTNVAADGPLRIVNAAGFVVADLVPGSGQLAGRVPPTPLIPDDEVDDLREQLAEARGIVARWQGDPMLTQALRFIRGVALDADDVPVSLKQAAAALNEELTGEHLDVDDIDADEPEVVHPEASGEVIEARPVDEFDPDTLFDGEGVSLPVCGRDGCDLQVVSAEPHGPHWIHVKAGPHGGIVSTEADHKAQRPVEPPKFQALAFGGLDTRRPIVEYPEPCLDPTDHPMCAPATPEPVYAERQTGALAPDEELTPVRATKRLALMAGFLLGVTEVMTPEQAMECWQAIVGRGADANRLARARRCMAVLAPDLVLDGLVEDDDGAPYPECGLESCHVQVMPWKFGSDHWAHVELDPAMGEARGVDPGHKPVPPGHYQAGTWGADVFNLAAEGGGQFDNVAERVAMEESLRAKAGGVLPHELGFEEGSGWHDGRMRNCADPACRSYTDAHPTLSVEPELTFRPGWPLVRNDGPVRIELSEGANLLPSDVIAEHVTKTLGELYYRMRAAGADPADYDIQVAPTADLDTIAVEAVRKPDAPPLHPELGALLDGEPWPRLLTELIRAEASAFDVLHDDDLPVTVALSVPLSHQPGQLTLGDVRSFTRRPLAAPPAPAGTRLADEQVPNERLGAVVTAARAVVDLWNAGTDDDETNLDEQAMIAPMSALEELLEPLPMDGWYGFTAWLQEHHDPARHQVEWARMFDVALGTEPVLRGAGRTWLRSRYLEYLWENDRWAVTGAGFRKALPDDDTTIDRPIFTPEQLAAAADIQAQFVVIDLDRLDHVTGAMVAYTRRRFGKLVHRG